MLANYLCFGPPFGRGVVTQGSWSGFLIFAVVQWADLNCITCLLLLVLMYYYYYYLVSMHAEVAVLCKTAVQFWFGKPVPAVTGRPPGLGFATHVLLLYCP